MSPEERLVAPGCVIFLTGANGYLGSHTVEQLLDLGYKVRGSVRSLDKIANLKARWDAKYPGRFEAVEIVDLAKKGAFDNVLDGVSGFAHTAADVTFSTDFDSVVNLSVQSTLNALRAATAHDSIKSFVLTSSYVAATMPQTGKDGNHIGPDSWNNEAEGMARSLPNDHFAKGFATYMAAKVAGEQAAWKYVKEEKPSYVFNTVLPGFCIGEVLDTEKQWGSTGGILRDIFLGKSYELAKGTPIQAMVLSTDVGLVHVGALVLGGINNQRLYATGHLATWNDMLAIFRSNYPNKRFHDDFDPRRIEQTSYDDAVAGDILKRLGRSGWKPLEEAILETVRPVADQVK